MNKPTLSVVMPTRNDAAWLPFAMASALASDVTDLELIVVNDGSEDDTAEVISCFEGRDSRVRVRAITWDGVNEADSAMREGLALARGEFIAFMGSDDLVQPWLWSTMIAVLRARHVGLVYADMLHVEAAIEDGWLVATGPFKRVALPDWNPQLLARRNYIPDTSMARTDVLKLVGIPIDCERRYMHLLWQMLAKGGLVGVHLPSAGYIYVQRDDSLTRTLGRWQTDGLTKRGLDVTKFTVEQARLQPC